MYGWTMVVKYATKLNAMSGVPTRYGMTQATWLEMLKENAALESSAWCWVCS